MDKQHDDYKKSLLVLIAAVMKANGTVSRAELDYVKRFLVKNFSEEEAKEALVTLRDLLKADIRVKPICEKIRLAMTYSLRLQMVYFLANLAYIKGRFAPASERIFYYIEGRLGIRPVDRAAIWAVFYNNTNDTKYTDDTNDDNDDNDDSTKYSYRRPRSYVSPSALDMAYSLLGISRNSDNETVKKAYRTMAVKYHPDKVAYLGDELRKTAKEKFQRLNEAYELIKKNKGIA